MSRQKQEVGESPNGTFYLTTMYFYYTQYVPGFVSVIGYMYSEIFIMLGASINESKNFAANLYMLNGRGYTSLFVPTVCFSTKIVSGTGSAAWRQTNSGPIIASDSGVAGLQQFLAQYYENIALVGPGFSMTPAYNASDFEYETLVYNATSRCYGDARFYSTAVCSDIGEYVADTPADLHVVGDWQFGVANYGITCLSKLTMTTRHIMEGCGLPDQTGKRLLTHRLRTLMCGYGIRQVT